VEGFVDAESKVHEDWPQAAGQPLVVVGFNNWNERIPTHRKELLRRAIDTGKLRLIQLPSGLNIGGVMREVQSSFGDFLMVIGGGSGAHHSTSLYLSEHKAIIPLDLPLRPSTEEKKEGEKLAIAAMQNPNSYFQFDRTLDASAAYTNLSFTDGLVPLDTFETSVFEFISHIRPRQAFFVRLQDDDNPEFMQVSTFFRNVIEPVIKESGYQKFEVGADGSLDQFLNVEIFKQIDFSSLVVVDLTGLRQNCFMELGYAFGQGKKVIICAKKGTNLPFDTKSIPCHFWKSDLSSLEQQQELRDFMNVNIGRGPLVKEQSFLDQPFP
jgi:hypothetical protein